VRLQLAGDLAAQLARADDEDRAAVVPRGRSRCAAANARRGGIADDDDELAASAKSARNARLYVKYSRLPGASGGRYQETTPESSTVAEHDHRAG
jgi:hypothetical protein